MKILITGANGFIGRNLAAELVNRGYNDLYLHTRACGGQRLLEACTDCEFVFHLAGVNRPEREEEFVEGNVGLLADVLKALEHSGNKAPVLLTSSIQAMQENPYGKSKRAAEEFLREEGGAQGRKTILFRLGNVFGKWCRPNYNSVVATFCHNTANDIPLAISDRDKEMNLLYIDDVVNELISAMEGKSAPAQDGFYYVHQVSAITLGRLASLLHSFRAGRTALQLPDMKDKLTRELYATYLTYLPEDQFSYPLNMHEDHRGSFTEFIRTEDRGQVSVNVSKPGVTKGNHWHHTKNEKFLVVKGQGVVRFRKIGAAEVLEYPVSGEKLEVVDIPAGYTHNITNTGTEDMITVMWASEPFDPERPDTYYLEV